MFNLCRLSKLIVKVKYSNTIRYLFCSALQIKMKIITCRGGKLYEAKRNTLSMG